MVDKSCPVCREVCCFITGVVCEYNNKNNCPDYINYVPKRPLTRQVWEGIQINRLGNPIQGIQKGIDNVLEGLI